MIMTICVSFGSFMTRYCVTCDIGRTATFLPLAVSWSRTDSPPSRLRRRRDPRNGFRRAQGTLWDLGPAGPAGRDRVSGVPSAGCPPRRADTLTAINSHYTSP